MSVCQSEFDNKLYYHLTNVPAVVVICILQLYTYRQTKKLKLLLPFSFFTDNDHKRTSTVLAFGAIANTFINTLTLGNFMLTSQSWVWGPLTNLISVAEIGFLYFPIFTCIHSPYVTLASVLGSIYTMFITIGIFVRLFHVKCEGESQLGSQVLSGFAILPDIVCSFGIMFKFIHQIFKSIKTGVHEERKDKILKKYQQQYVKKLFNPSPIEGSLNLVAKYVWKNDPYFKFSTIILSSVIIFITLLYRIAIKGLYYLHIMRKWSVIKRAFIRSAVILGAIVLLIGVLQLYFFMKTHRKDMKNVYKKGPKEVEISNTSTIQRNLFFPGYFIAHMVFGQIVCLLFILFFTTPFIFLAQVCPDCYKEVIVPVLKNVYGLFIIPIVIYIVQRCLVFFVFSPRVNDERAFIKKMGFYHIVLYFSMFCNLLLGVFSCLYTVFLSAIVSLVCLGRIDRIVMNPKYFKRFHRGHLAYLSFLKVEGVHKNPIMRCFCSILFALVSNQRYFDPRDTKIFMISPTSYRVSRRALNRWHLAVMLLRNPALMQYRIKAKQKTKYGNFA
ncbi:stimulated by retinoic acid gene 6 protein-like [Hydractinia symbiolongicarpus]|uniref:stimulated by retinoic acid gene 6 protein-like n=1 Tax=Hydractinia symbiolongicarpus TaxID=13093 RepID=UPI00254F5519|nr:stimulated by retinoic acid gene 6 protein-like [Hydractinia symbiolongicarpus]